MLVLSQDLYNEIYKKAVERSVQKWVMPTQIYRDELMISRSLLTSSLRGRKKVTNRMVEKIEKFLWRKINIDELNFWSMEGSK